MKEWYPGVRMAALAAVLALGGAACSGSSGKPPQATGSPRQSPKPPAVLCTKINPELWGPIPDEVDTARLARAFGIPEEQMRQGEFGGAACAREIAPQEIVPSGFFVSIQDIAKLCVVAGYAGDHPPADKPNRNVLVACPPDR